VVAPVRRIVLDSSELLRVVKNELVLMDRGGIPLLRILGQAYDGVNVTALEVDLGPTRFLNVRKLDKAFELRLQAAWRKAVLHADMDLDMPRVRLCVVTIIA
jgi:hypothetical protein